MRELVNAAEAVVGAFPAKPWIRSLLVVADEGIGGEGNGEDHVDGRKAHKAEIAIGGEVGVARKEPVELCLSFV